MKKTKYIFLFFLFFAEILSVNAQQITGNVLYKVSLKKDFKMINDSLLKTKRFQSGGKLLKEYLLKTENAVKENTKFIEINLIFNTKEALYKAPEEIRNGMGFDMKMAVITTGVKAVIYFDRENEKILRQTEAYGQLFLIESALNAREWVLTQESKTIGGYLCYKATSTLVTKNSVGTFYKPITAWYAPKLPVPYGPKGYGGLPGLILQLTEGDFTFYVSKLTLNPKKAIKIKRPIKGKKVTQAAFEKIGEESRFNFVKMKN